MLLGALVTSLQGSLLSDKEVIRAGDGVSRSGNGIKKRTCLNVASSSD